jgi:hypothetical protein
VKVAEGKQVRWVSGHFDPLLAVHVRRLREMSAPDQELAVLVTNSESPLLPQRARAELVAALAPVAWVAMQEGPGASDLDDDRVTQEFVGVILSKHGASA